MVPKCELCVKKVFHDKYFISHWVCILNDAKIMNFMCCMYVRQQCTYRDSSAHKLFWLAVICDFIVSFVDRKLAVPIQELYP